MNRKKRIIARMLLISVMTLWACGSGQDMEQKETKITEQSAGEISVNAEHTGKRDNTEHTGYIDNDNPKSHSEHTENTEGTGNTDSKGHRENTGTIEGAENTGYTADQKDEEQMAGQRQLSLYLTEGYQEEWEEDFTSLCHVSWQELMLSEEEAKKYPELAEALKERNEISAGYYQAALEELLPMAREACGLDAEFFSPFFQESTLTVQRADELIVSIREDFSDYSGGVHGMYGVYGINYDTATGEVLELTDILKDITPLPGILAEKIRTVYGDEYETYESLQEDLAQEYEPEEYHWTMGYQGITFYFLPYEIASYAEGMLRVTLWFDEFPELIKEAYTMMPENGYAMAMPIGHEIDVDLDPADDRKDRIVVSSFSETEEEQTYGIEWLRIGKNDTWYKATEGYGYQFTPYLVCTKEQGVVRYFIYAEAVSENDYRTLYVYDLNEEEIRLQTSMDGVGFMGYWEEDAGAYGKYYRHVLLDPASIELGARMHILGTHTGRKIYTADQKSGLPVTDMEDYLIDGSSNPLISSIPLEVTMLPGTATEELPAGTSFEILRTDGAAYVDMRLEDGRECRMSLEYGEGGYRIQGISEWECFEEILYAG